MDKQKILEFYLTHKIELIGAFAGLFFAIIILSIGIFKTIFILICISLGYFIGKKISMDKNFFNKLLDKIFPPGMYR